MVAGLGGGERRGVVGSIFWWWWFGYFFLFFFVFLEVLCLRYGVLVRGFLRGIVLRDGGRRVLRGYGGGGDVDFWVEGNCRFGRLDCGVEVFKFKVRLPCVVQGTWTSSYEVCF